MKNQKHLLIVRSGYPSKEFVLKKLRALGYFLIVLDETISCPTELVDDWVIADMSSEKACLKAVKHYLKDNNHKIDGVLTFWEEAVLITAKLADSLNLPGIPFKSAEIIKNKFSFREACSAFNLPSPKHAMLQIDSNFSDVVKGLNFPLVVKPIYGAASAFVVRVNNLRELKKAFVSINKYIKSFWLTPEWKSVDLLVEEYIEGQEVDIDMILQDGNLKFYSITDNFQTHEPFFVETGQALPSRLADTKQQELVEMAMTVLKSLNVTDAIVHFEAKTGLNGPVPIEVNLRMGGDEVYSFIKTVWGIDFIEYAAKIAIGDHFTIKKPTHPLTHLEGRYFLPNETGRIANITIPRSVTQNPHLFELKVCKNIGDEIKIPPQDFDYFGWITAQGNSSEEAHISLNRMFSRVKFALDLYERPTIQTYI
jgi:carnosine synthase